MTKLPTKIWYKSKYQLNKLWLELILSSEYTANTYSGKTVEVQWNHCDFEKIQWFTTDHASLFFLPVKIEILALFYM